MILRSSRILPPAGHLERGAAMVEAAICLPVFFLIVFGVIQYGVVFGREMALRRALAMAAGAFEGASSLEGLSEQLCFQKAGEVFRRELQNMGVSFEEAALNEVEPRGEPYVLAGMPFLFKASRAALMPPAYQLRAYYRPRCLLCGLLPLPKGSHAAAVSLIESGNACVRTGHTGEAAVYAPERPVGSRVAWLSVAQLP